MYTWPSFCRDVVSDLFDEDVRLYSSIVSTADFCANKWPHCTIFSCLPILTVVNTLLMPCLYIIRPLSI